MRIEKVAQEVPTGKANSSRPQLNTDVALQKILNLRPGIYQGVRILKEQPYCCRMALKDHQRPPIPFEDDCPEPLDQKFFCYTLCGEGQLQVTATKISLLAPINVFNEGSTNYHLVDGFVPFARFKSPETISRQSGNDKIDLFERNPQTATVHHLLPRPDQPFVHFHIRPF